MNTKQILILLLASFLFVACASTTIKPKQQKFEAYLEKNQIAEVSKVRSFKMQDWTSLDYRHIILSSSHSKRYLITLGSYCPELVRVNSIALKQSMEFSLSSKFDSIIVVDHQSHECRIQKIHPLTKQQAKEVRELR